MSPKKYFAVKSQAATRLRKRKYELVKQFKLPENALGGYLSQTLRNCGKANCRCSFGEGHPRWSLDFSYQGKKQTEILPESIALEVESLVEQGRQYREAIMELLAINLQLFRMWHKQERDKSKKKRAKVKRK